MGKKLWDCSVEFESMAKHVQMYIKHGKITKAYQMIQEMEKKKWELFSLMISEYLAMQSLDYCIEKPKN